MHKGRQNKGFNKYQINGDITTIFLTDAYDKIIASTIIDTEDLQKLIDLNLCFHASLKRKSTNDYYCDAIQYKRLENGEIKKKTFYLHRIILGINDRKIRVDHVDYNPLNNRKNNLRLSNASTNSTHRKKLNNNNKTGYRNVCVVDNKLIVQLQINGKNTLLGSFEIDRMDDAVSFAQEMRQKYYGEFAGK